MEKNGFTLVELLEVIVVIILVKVLIMNNFFGILGDSKDKIDEIQLNNLKEAVILYAKDNNIKNCALYCTEEQKLTDVCVNNKNYCKENPESSKRVTLNTLITNKYFTDKGNSCNPKNTEILVYMYNIDYYVDLGSVSCKSK